MILQINNRLTEETGRWRYTGTITHNTKDYNISGVVPMLKTQGMIKRAIIKDVQTQILERLKDKPQLRTKILSPDGNFVTR